MKKLNGVVYKQYTIYIFYLIIRQIAGSVLLGIGIWLVADKASFISLLRMVENEHVQVNTSLYYMQKFKVCLKTKRTIL